VRKNLVTYVLTGKPNWRDESTMANRVEISRTYRSASTGELVLATSPESWVALGALVDRLGLRAAPVVWADGSDGMVVVCESERGETGAFALQSMACRYGALAVVM